MNHDIGLYKLDRDAQFWKGILEPICLPSTFDKSDVARREAENMVYIAGWGRLWGGKCLTNELGPQKNLKCNFGGQTNQYACSRTLTASMQDRHCKSIWRAYKAKYKRKPKHVISVYLPDEKRNKTCYTGRGESGWCYTVSDMADNSENWGFCQDHCKYKVGTKQFEENILARKLQETKLHILPMAHCRSLIQNRNYDFVGRFEFCAGRKKKFQFIDHYVKEGNRYLFKSKDKNYLGLNKGNRKYLYEYYVSSSDACAGDSGGGVYQWRNGIPTLIGVVARGWGSNDETGCAEMNYPGVYTRVMLYLEWIYENSNSGYCKVNEEEEELQELDEREKMITGSDYGSVKYALVKPNGSDVFYKVDISRS